MVLVPFGPLRWYRLVRYDGTDCSATVVPIRPLRWYRLTDTINKLMKPNQMSRKKSLMDDLTNIDLTSWGDSVE